MHEHANTVPVRLLEMGDSAILVETADIDDVLVLAPALDDLVHSGDPDLAAVTDARFLAHPGLGPGAAAERIITVLGEPVARDAAALRYECGDVGAPVVFRLAGDTVRAVELDYYVD